MAYGGGLEGRRRPVRTTEGGVAEERFEFAPRASFEIGRRSVLGTNGSANLVTSVSVPFFASRDTSSSQSTNTPTEYRLIGTFREPRVFGTPADASLNVTFEQQIRSSFDFRRRGASAELGHRITRAVSVSGSYQIQRTEVFNENVTASDQRLIDQTFTQVRLSSVTTSLIRDTKDDEVDPANGEYFSANGQLAARGIGSEVGFVKSFFTAQAFRTVPHTRRIVFAANARLGFAAGFEREAIDKEGHAVLIKDLPQSERFYAGGDTTVRGFALDALGVRHTPAQENDTIDKDGFPLGGNALMILNGELRVPATHGVQVAAFVDSGNVFAKPSEIDLTELRTAVGFGVRYKSPVGPIRVDLGFKVNRQTGEGLTAWFVTFGQAF
jgi:outer membrane protein assembly factor BamA